MKTLFALLLIGTATPALAQHAGHTMPAPAPAPVSEPEEVAAPEEVVQPAMDHGAMDHSQMNHGKDAEEPMDHSQMGHAPAEPMAQDHSQMGHSTMAAPIANAPPPASAGMGPPRAADAIWGAEAMRASRDQLRHDQGGQTYFWFQGDRLEYRAREGEDGYLWDVQGYYGGDIEKFWFKSEGEGTFGEPVESAEIQALYSRAIAPFFDFQAGVRQDLAQSDRTYAVIGVQGLLPYQFEVDTAVFLSNKGDVTARVEAELDQRITQRLILQPRTEINFSAQDVPELGVGAGVDTAELGLRLRYEFSREFAPYIGVEQEWRVGQSADYARASGEDPSVTNFVVGLRFWF